MKKTYKTPKVISVSEKMNSALLNGVLWFVLRSLTKGHTSLSHDAEAVKTLQVGR